MVSAAMATPIISFSQQVLCDITFSRKQVPVIRNGITEGQPITKDMLQNMYDMVQVEFAESLKKEIESPEDDAIENPIPKPYDIFQVEPNLSSGNVELVICVPIKKPRVLKSDRPRMVWLDNHNKLWLLDDLTPKRRVGSLSGSSRILDVLSGGEFNSRLMLAAMGRTSLYTVNEEECKTTLLSCQESAMHESQRQAIVAMTAEGFHFGFLVLQGPPGCGKTTTIVGMIKAAIHDTSEKILVCAPSNAAVANIALKLEQENLVDESNLLVFGGNVDISVRHLSPNKPEDDDGSQLLRLLEASRIVLCTLNSSGSKHLCKSGDRELIFLDEAGQCPEG